MTLIDLLKRVEKIAADNSPVILTGIGVAGTLTTAYLTGRAAFKAGELLSAEWYEGGERYSFKQKVRESWKLYLPAVGSGAMTIGAIICANRIGTRRAAAVATAYALSERAFSEYKEKVVETLGEKKERAVRDAVAADQVQRNPQAHAVIIGSGKVLCHDAYTDRFFESSMEEIKKAQNDTNYEILHNSYCSLGDFYSRLGLAGTSFSEEMGWTSDHLLEVMFSTVLTADGKPCLSFSFAVQPVRDYYKFG